MGEHEHRRPIPSSAVVRAAAQDHPVAHSVLRLQRDAGNGAVASALDRSRSLTTSAKPQSVLQRAPLSRAEHIAALKLELADADADFSIWPNIVTRLNTVDPVDLSAVIASIPNHQLQAAHSAVERSSLPSRAAILATLQARAKKKAVKVRPLGSSIWATYSQVSYAALKKPEVWEKIGGSIAKKFSGDTCSARVSWALNYGGYPVSDRGNVNEVTTKHKGKNGDGMRYIVWVPTLQSYLTARWGKPDAVFGNKDAAIKFEAALKPGEVAVFASAHHAGVIKKGYDDPYVKSDDGIMPVSVWKLPM